MYLFYKICINSILYSIYNIFNIYNIFTNVNICDYISIYSEHFINYIGKLITII